MALLDFFYFNKINRFKRESNKEIKLQKRNQLADTVSVREQNTNEMFDSIAKYTNKRNSLLSRSILLDENNITNNEASLIINDFFENIVEQLPKGIIIPIKTTFVYKGKEQILLIGKNIMTIGKFLKPNVTKPRHGMKGRSFVAFFIDNNEEFDFFNQIKNNRIKVSPDRGTKIINLVNESIIDCKTDNFRISNIEISFTQWEKSLDCIISTKDNDDLTNQILEYLLSLDFEITTGITSFLNSELDKLEDIDNKAKIG